MDMKSGLLCFFATVILFATALPAQQSSPRSGPSLQETDDWIRQTFNDDNTGMFGCDEFERGMSDDYGSGMSCAKTQYHIKIDGCRVTLYVSSFVVVSPGTNGNVRDISPSDDSIATFDLHDIDPASITAGQVRWMFGDPSKKTFHENSPSFAQVQIETTNGKDAISVVYTNRETKVPSQPKLEHSCCTLIGHGIAVKPDYAPRFVKAIRHATELCGGHPSAF